MILSRLRHAVLALRIPPLARVIARAKRGQELAQWGLNPHRADLGTPMQLDDEDGYDQMIPEGLTGTAVYPIMNATDALSAVCLFVAHAANSTPSNHHAASFLALCRTATEGASQAIWLLSPTDRAERRARAAGLAKVGAGHAQEYHADRLKAHENKIMLIPDQESVQQSRHRLKFHKNELEELEKLPARNGRNYTDLVRKAANWIEANPPKHTSETDKIHVPTVVQSYYRVCSGFVHGHSWAIDLTSSPHDMFAMMADALATALITTEVAVCLFEAQSTAPNGSRRNAYPARLQPTIDAWRELYATSNSG